MFWIFSKKHIFPLIFVHLVQFFLSRAFWGAIYAVRIFFPLHFQHFAVFSILSLIFRFFHVFFFVFFPFIFSCLFQPEKKCGFKFLQFPYIFCIFSIFSIISLYFPYFSSVSVFFFETLYFQVIYFLILYIFRNHSFFGIPYFFWEPYVFLTFF